MPGLTGLGLQRDLQTKRKTLAIIFITGHGDVFTSVRAMKSGAMDFLEKPVKDKDLLKAIEQAPARAAHDRADRKELEDIHKRIDTLTPLEREVMTMVV